MNSTTEASNFNVPKRRYLSPSESVSTPAHNTMRLAVRCHGNLDLPVLQDAWRTTHREFPGLMGTVRETGNGSLVFVPNCGRVGLIDYTDIHPDGERLTAHKVLDDFDTAAALQISTTGTEHTVSLLLRHSIADGRYGIGVMERLWSVYTTLINGGEPTHEAHRVPMPLEILLEERTVPSGQARNLGDSSPAIYLHAPDPSNPNLRGLRHASVRLQEGHTKSLISLSKSTSTSMHSIIAAALVTSMAHVRNQATPIDLASVIDVRPHLIPPANATEVTYGLGVSLSTIPSAALSNMGTIARQITDDIRTDLESGIAQRSSTVNPDLSRRGSVPTMFSNLGRVPKFATPWDLVTSDFSAWNEMDLDNPGSTDLATTYGNMIVASSYGGRLRIDLFHGLGMFEDDWTTRIATGMEDRLIRVADDNFPSS